MIRSALFICALALTGCTEFQTAVDSSARQGSRGVVAETLALHFQYIPQEQITAHTDCVVTNANAEELREFGRVTLSGIDDVTILTVRGILARPETQACLSSSAA